MVPGPPKLGCACRRMCFIRSLAGQAVESERPCSMQVSTRFPAFYAWVGRLGISEADRRACETRLNVQATNAETQTAMSVSTTRMPTWDAARRTGDCECVL